MTDAPVVAPAILSAFREVPLCPTHRDRAAYVHDHGFDCDACLTFKLSAALAAQRAETPHEDTKRLDWLDAQREAEWHVEHDEQVLDWFFWQTRGQCYSIREAIDHDERRQSKPERKESPDADTPF